MENINPRDLMSQGVSLLLPLNNILSIFPNNYSPLAGTVVEHSHLKMSVKFMKYLNFSMGIPLPLEGF